MVKQLFTPAKANRTLPLVRQIVADILAKGQELRAEAATSTDDEGVRRIKALNGEILGLMEELERVGCYYKDWSFNLGLVDFPAEIEGEPVFLCWRSDEEKVTWYHPIEDGFAGRTPIPRKLLEEETTGSSS